MKAKIVFNLKSVILLILYLSVYNNGIGSLKPSFLSKDSMDLYLLIGQSNMAGRAPIKSVEEDTLKNIFLYTGSGWEPAANPLNKYSNVRKTLSMQKLGPGYGFAVELEKYTKKKIGLIVNARGGTRIAWWEKGYKGENDFDLYEQTVLQVKKAMKDGCLRGIVWHQGEGDVNEPEKYMMRLKRLAKDLRFDLGVNVFFIAGEIGQWRKKNARINHVIQSISNNIENSDYVSTNGLSPLHGDTTNPHFDTHSQLILGKRYANKVLKKVYNIKSE